MVITAIIQARMGSSRMPSKILKKLYKYSMLEHIIERVKFSEKVENIVIATTNLEIDDPIVEIADKWQVQLYRGSEDDVLDRFYQAATENMSSIIVRITADDPFKDASIIDQSIRILLDNHLDYVSNTMHPTFPEGLDIEVFTIDALTKAWNEAKLNSEREHVTPYIWKNPTIFKIKNFEMKDNQNLSNYRWTVDYDTDFQFSQEVYKKIYDKKPNFNYIDVLSLFEQFPELMNIMNQNVIRNEGYLKSLKEEGTK